MYKLYIEEAELFPTYLNVSFNHPARLAEENNTWSCTDLWEDETVMTFGTESTCTLSDDRRSLQVMLGKLARVKVGDEVRMKYGILLVDDCIVVEPTELSAITMTRAVLVPLHAVLLAADAVQACSNVTVSLAASTGFARRAPIIEWSLGNNTDEMLRAMLQPTLNDANAIMSQILQIPAQIFSDAISEVLDLEPEAGASEKFLELEVAGSISNWQSQGAEVSAQLTVLDVRTPLLQIVPASLKEFNISNFEEVEMEVDIFQHVRCFNYSSTAKDSSVLMVQWEYLLLNDTICMEEVPRWMDTSSSSENMSNDSNGSNDSNDSNDSSTSSSWNDSNDSNDSNASNMSDTIMIARPCVKAIWQPLENTSFRDENPRPGSLRLPAFSFQPGSGSHQFRAVATFQGYDGRKPSVIFTVNVQERSRPVAIITGPSEVSAACPFNLSAHESYDASVPKEDPSRLEFSWSCFVGVLTGLNETEQLDAQECNLSSSIDDWREQPTLEMEGDVLEEGDYTFMVKVRPVRDVPNGTLAELPGPQGPPPPHPAPPPPQPTGEAWWVMRLGRRRLPLVVLRMPWDDGEDVSMLGPEGPAVAQVSGTATCPVPFDWRWHWVLTQQGRILAALKTTVQSLGTSVEVSSHDFRGDLLHPRQSYRYALVATSEVHQAPSGLLSELPKALVLESVAFVANAPPRDGLLELVPLSGEGLITPFAVNTFGWTDEAEKLLSYSFVRFPFESSRISADGSGGITFQNGFQWSVPKIDWHNASSPMYFRKQGGLTLQTWDSSSRVSDLLMAVGSYFIMVRARDLQGGEGTAAVLGPVVVEPVNGSNGMTVLEASYTARDAERIMNTVDALLASETVEWDASPTASLLDALEVATSILDPRPEALEKMTQILVSTVGGGGGTAGIVQNKAELDRAANILDNCLNLAVASPENGVGSVVAVAMLEALSTFNEGGRLGSLEPSEESTRFTEKMDRLASKVATAAHAKLAVGDSKFLSGAGVPGRVPNEPPSGVNLQLISSANSVLVDSGLDMPRLFMPPNLLQPSPGHPSPGHPGHRRLQACDVAITATYWLRSNPYTWASSSKGMNQYVTADTTVGVLEFETCGMPLAFNESIPERTLRFRRITLPARRAPMRGFEWDVACARWSPLEQAWVTGGVEVQRPVYWDDVEVACVVYAVPDGNGTAFTAFFVPVEISTTTTTVEWTYPTYTTFEIPPLPPVYVISCNSSLLPEPPLGSSWNCTKPGEGQECRAVCEGFPDQITSVTCLKGQSSLEWFVTNVCPLFTTSTLDMTIDRPSENAILGSVLVFVFIIIFCCSFGICALMAYGLYKFTMNEKSKSRISSMQPQPVEEEEEEEDVVDPAFMDWAKHWAENPTVQSALLERKLKAKSQEHLEAAVPHESPAEDAKATASSAFTKTVELEFHEYWKSELEGILFSNQIPLDAEGRLYWVVNSVREILQVKDLQSLHQVNFPLTVRMQESPPQVEKAEGFYFWQVEWGALKGPANATKKDDMEFDAPDEEKIDGIVPELSQRQQEHEDLMKKWKEQKAQDRLRQTADPSAPGDKAKSPKTPGKSHGYPPALAPSSPSSPTLDLGVQTALHRSAKAGQVRLSSDYGGALAQTAAQASIYVPELQDQLYKEQVGQSMEDDDDGWLEVQSPSGRIYYWNQFTNEEWDPPAEDLEPE